jgi:hypothetical protein
VNPNKLHVHIFWFWTSKVLKSFHLRIQLFPARAADFQLALLWIIPKEAEAILYTKETWNVELICTGFCYMNKLIVNICDFCRFPLTWQVVNTYMAWWSIGTSLWWIAIGDWSDQCFMSCGTGFINVLSQRLVIEMFHASALAREMFCTPWLVTAKFPVPSLDKIMFHVWLKSSINLVSCLLLCPKNDIKCFMPYDWLEQCFKLCDWSEKIVMLRAWSLWILFNVSALWLVFCLIDPRDVSCPWLKQFIMPCDWSEQCFKPDWSKRWMCHAMVQAIYHALMIGPSTISCWWLLKEMRRDWYEKVIMPRELF